MVLCCQYTEAKRTEDMPEFSPGSEQHLEKVLSQRGRGISRERKLLIVLLYLHVNATRDILGLMVDKNRLSSFLSTKNGLNVNRYNFLYALDTQEQTRPDSPINIKLPVSCIRIEYETGGCAHGHGSPIARVRLNQGDVIAALHVLGKALSCSWEETLSILGCTEEDLRIVQERNAKVYDRPTHDVGEKTSVPHVPPSTRTQKKENVLHAQRVLKEVIIQRGRSAHEVNLQRVFDALWSASEIVGTPGILSREVFEVLLVKVDGAPAGRRHYFDELFDRRCFDGAETKISQDRGHPIVTIHLSCRKVKEKEKLPEKKLAVKVPTALARAGSLQSLSVPGGFLDIPMKERDALEARQESHKAVQQRDTRSDVSTAFVFVDAANINNRFAGRDGTDNVSKEIGRRIAPVNEIHWENFYNFMKAGIHGPLAIRHAFVYLYAGVPYANDVEKMVRQAKFTPVLHPKPDADTQLANDFIKVAEAMHDYKNITVVLVSGDGDFNRGLENLRRMADARGVTLKIWVIAWTNGINQRLRNVIADDVTRTEDVLHTICPTSVWRLKNTQRVTVSYISYT